jgi:hypothetical protein
MEETFAAQLEWWGNAAVCMRFDVLVAIEERNADLAARGWQVCAQHPPAGNG